jgi:putative ABC transport system permease protein
METLWQDVRFGWRNLTRTRGFALIALAMLALGIGANTAMFSVVNAVLLRPLPFREPGRIVSLSGYNAEQGVSGRGLSYQSFLALQSQTHSFEHLSTFVNDSFTLTGSGEAEELSAARVSAAFFDVLGVHPTFGRGFVPDEDHAGARNVVVLSRGIWMRHFGADPQIVGRSVMLSGISYDVVGVFNSDMPSPYDTVDVWTTKAFEPSMFTPLQVQMGAGYLVVVGRLAPGVMLAAAQSEVDAVARRYVQDNPTFTDADPHSTLRIEPIMDPIVRPIRPALLALTAGVGLVLLIACANLANLLLVRAAARRGEAAVRVALGASRLRIVRQLCTESAMLGIAGGVLGTLVARWTIDLAASQIASLPRGSEIRIDAGVLIFSATVSLVTGVLFGLAPALLASRVNLVEALKGASRSAASGTSRTGRALVIGEVALTLMLLVASGLLLQSFLGLLKVPLGFQPEGLLTMRLSLSPGRFASPEAMAERFERIVARVEQVPGVASAAASLNLPPASLVRAPLYVAGFTPEAMGERPVAVWSGITPQYFSTMRIPLLAGRGFSSHDGAGGQRVAIVSQSLAKKIFGRENPIGHRIQIGRLPGLSEIVGIAGEVKNVGIESEALPQVYSPYVQRPWTSMSLVARAGTATGDPRRLVGAVRAAIQEVDRDQAVTDVQTMEEGLASSIAQTRVIAVLLGAFAAIAVAMAAAGLYGVIAYTVTQRTREIAVRLALGARPGTVFWLIVRQGLWLTGFGIAFGIAGAIVATRAMSTLLFGVDDLDPLTYVGVSMLLVGVAMAACYLPARRAARISPITALRAS